MPQNVTHLDDDARVGPLRVVIAVSRYNGWITDRLRDGALEAIERLEPGSEAVVAPASGSLELPTIAGEAAMSGDFDAVVALGCVIKGETEHDRHISQAIIGTLTQTSVSSGVPIGIGVLTVNDAAQAEARAGGTLGNKGAEAMEAAIASVRVLRGLRAYSEGAVAGGEKAP